MSLYTNAVQRNRYNMYIASQNGQQNPNVGGAPNPATVRFNLRKSGFLYKPELYQGCIIGVNTFQSSGFSAASATNIYQGGTAGAPPANSNGQGSSIHIVLKEGGQANGSYNLNASLGGLIPGVNVGQFNTPNILATAKWQSLPPIQTGDNPLTCCLDYTNEGGDPVGNGIFIPSPYDDFTIELRMNDWTLVDLTRASLDAAGNTVDVEWFMHLVVQPVLKSYEVPVHERILMDN